MRLLTTDTGWAATEHKLFWTTDGGAQWKDITPKLNHKKQRVSSVFFLDASTGWALLSCGDDKDPIADDVCFEFAITADAGENWSVAHPKISDPGIDRSNIGDGVGAYSGTAFLNFADPQHGWAILKKSYGLQRSEGEMLRTVDGGSTWTQLSSSTLPVADAFRFEGPKDGWIVDGRQGNLYVSHDAGNSWQEASLPKPASVGSDTGVSYDLPVFENEHRGLLLARYAVGPLMGPDLSTLVLFATGDGGRTWKEERILSKLPEIYSSELAGSVLIAAHSEQAKTPSNGSGQRPAATKLSLYTLGPNQDHTSNTSEVSSQGAAIQLSFVDGDQGWANLTDRLLATRDAGRTWVDVTPGGPARGPAGAVQPHIGTSLPQASTPPASAQISDSSSTASSHVGFDGYNVPTITQMTAWMTSSPFYDVYIYLPNSPNRHNDPILVSTKGAGWVSSIQGQGWGVVPVWFGLQSACDKATNITQYISATPATASTQGAEEADQAVAQDKLLGISAGIIFLDIENYTPDHSTCSLAVQAYVDGFVSEIAFYSGYSAGVYANPAPINSDISLVSPAPAAIWIAKYDGHVAIWNEGIKDYLWPNGQRMHQFLTNTNPKNAPNATWGGVPLSIDYDIDNGPVVNANQGVKSYSYFFSNYSYPGAILTFAYGINDVWGDGMINGPNEAGQIVGYYLDSAGSGHGFLLDALAQWSTVDYPGQVTGAASGINNLGQIVGYWQDSSGCYHGYLNSGGAYKSFDNPNAVCAQGGTFFYGINDAGQITGLYYDNSGWQSFLYYQGQYYPVNCPGAVYTNAGSINGDGMTTETASPGGGCVESLIPPSWTGAFSFFFDAAGLQTYAEDINNNGDVAGFYEVQYLDHFGLMYTNNVQLISFQYPTNYDTYVYGVNDFGQIVGYSNNPGITPYQGFAALPQ